MTARKISANAKKGARTPQIPDILSHMTFFNVGKPFHP
jgi:hypothetical protein